MLSKALSEYVRLPGEDRLALVSMPPWLGFFNTHFILSFHFGTKVQFEVNEYSYAGLAFIIMLC